MYNVYIRVRISGLKLGLGLELGLGLVSMMTFGHGFGGRI